MTDHSVNSLPRIGITQGDINSIAYEIILKAFSDLRMLEMASPVLYGQSKALSYYKKNFGIDTFNYSLTRDVRQSWDQKFNIINIIDEELKIEPGKATALSAEMSVYALKKAVEDLQYGHLDALLLSPVCAEVEASQHDYLAAGFNKPDTLRMLVADNLRIGMVTGDIALRDALAQLDAARIETKLATLSQSLKSDFGFTAPKIAVIDIDPHASPTGFAAVAVEQARKKGVYAFGPFSASGLFASGLWSKYDAVLAMTYGQAMLPFRMMTANSGAYYWAGLPAVCTGPIHGPAFDIANANQASPDSFRAAVYLAIDIVRHRKDK